MFSGDDDGLGWYSRISLSYFIDKHGREYIFRFGSIKDFQGLLEMYSKFEPKRSIMGVPPDDSGELKVWVKHFFSKDTKNIVVMDPYKKIIGHAAIFPIDTKRCEYFMALLPTNQSSGIGRTLCINVIETARYLNFKKVWICVEKTNTKALNLHKKLGYSVNGGGFGEDYELEVEVDKFIV